MRAGLAALLVFVVVVVWRAGLPSAHADGAPTPPIPVHPGVVTVLELPDEIVHTWIDHHGEIRVARKGNKLYVRPRPGTPAGMEASLEVETRTVYQTFRLRVVARARDARRNILVQQVEVQAPEESTPAVRPEEPTEPEAPPVAATPEIAEPAASAPTGTVSPALAEPTGGPALSEKPAESVPALVPTAIRSQRPEISVHAIGGLGFTALDVAGSDPIFARQPYLSLGARLAVAPPDSSWALEASINGEWPHGPMVFAEEEEPTSPLRILNGPWVRAEMGMRVWVGTKWRPSVYAALGVQLHLRRETENTSPLRPTSETMPRAVVLILGAGLQRRAGDVVLGLDFQLREGGPDGYHSAAVLWTIGCYLDPD